MKTEDKLRLLLITAEFPPQIGGIATLTSQLARELHGRKYKGKEIGVHVVTSVGRKEREEFPFSVTRTPDVLNLKYLKILPLLIATVLVCLRDRPDKLLLGKWTHEGFVAFLVGKIMRIPYVTFVHGSEMLKFSRGRFFRSLLRGLLGAGDKVIAVSSYTKNLVIKLGLGSEKISVVHNALRVEDYDTAVTGEDFVASRELEGKTVLVTVSRLVERKGHDRVLEALSGIVGNRPDLVYLIAGDGDYREDLEAKVQSLDLVDHVRFLGFVEGADLSKLYAASDIFVMPNRIDENTKDVEGFGISFLEANLFGLPVIGGRSGGAVDAIRDGKTGYLVDPTGVEEIEERLMRLIKNEELRREMGERGRKRVLKKFNSGRQAKEVLEALWK